MEKAFGFNQKGSNGEPAVSSPFKQQKLPAWQPILQAKWIILFFLIVGIICVPIGAGLLVSSNNVKEIESRDYATCPRGRSYCPIINFTILNLDMNPPIFLYYKLENFFQNNRRYARSLDYSQLRGSNDGPSVDCDPMISLNGSSDPNLFFYPCGLQAQSVFNDTFRVFSIANGTEIPLNGDNIAWTSDVEYKFSNPSNFTTGIRVVPDLKNQDFIVWMRLAGLSTFRKLYRIINVSLKGDYTIQIANHYPVNQFGGKKYIVLTNNNFIGGKNPLIGIAYIFIGIVCLVVGGLFLLKELLKPREIGNTKYLIWGKSEVVI